MYKSFTISLWCEGMFYKNVLSKSSWQEDQCLQGTTTNKCKHFKFLDRNYFDENTFSKMFYRCTNSYLQAHWAILQALVRASFDIYRNVLYLRLNQVRYVRQVNSQREITRKIYEQSFCGCYGYIGTILLPEGQLRKQRRHSGNTILKRKWD